MSHDLGRLIRLRRADLNLSQEDVARKLAVKQPTVSNWERGRTQPSVEQLQTLCEILELDKNKIQAEVAGVFTGTERAITEDSLLSRRDKEIMLAVYGAVTGRGQVAATVLTALGDSPEPVAKQRPGHIPIFSERA